MAQLDRDGLYDLLWGFASHRVLTTATKTGILAHVAEQGKTPEQVSSELNFDIVAVRKILSALCSMGVLEARGEAFQVNEELRPMFLPGERYISAFVAHSEGLNDRWGAMLEPWLRGEKLERGEPTPEFMQKFGAAMSASANNVAPLVAKKIGLVGVATSLDVGGGVGRYAVAFCRENKELQASVLDRQGVVDIGREQLKNTEEGDRITFLGGDYHEADFGQGYDLVFFGNVLHQELAEEAAKLVQRGAAALAPGGRLVVADFAIDEKKREKLSGCLFAINMRDFGDTYSASQIRGWMKDAGLKAGDPITVTDSMWIIAGEKT